MGLITGAKRTLAKLDLVETGIGVAASYGIGQVHSRYREVEHIEHLPLAVGIAGKVGVLVASYLGYRGLATTVCSAVAQAGLNAAALSKGIADGMKATGRKMLVLPPGADTKGLVSSGGRDTILGEIPAPAHGKYLNRAKIADLARHV